MEVKVVVVSSSVLVSPFCPFRFVAAAENPNPLSSLDDGDDADIASSSFSSLVLALVGLENFFMTAPNKEEEEEEADEAAPLRLAPA